MTKEEWEFAANALLTERYGIDLNDCADGFAPVCWREMPPEEYVDWIGQKYDLIDIRKEQ